MRFTDICIITKKVLDVATFYETTKRPCIHARVNIWGNI